MRRNSVIKAALWRQDSQELSSGANSPKRLEVLNEAQLGSDEAMQAVGGRGGRTSLVDASVLRGFDIDLKLVSPVAQPGDADRARQLFFLKFAKDMPRVGVAQDFPWRRLEKLVPFHKQQHSIHATDREKASQVAANFEMPKGKAKARKSGFFAARLPPEREIKASTQALQILGQLPAKRTPSPASSDARTEVCVSPSSALEAPVVTSRKAAIVVQQPRLYDADKQMPVVNREAEEAAALLRENLQASSLEPALVEKVVARSLSPTEPQGGEDGSDSETLSEEQDAVRRHESKQKLVRRLKRELGSMEVKAWRYQQAPPRAVGCLASFERLMDRESAKFSFLSKKGKFENLKRRGLLEQHRLDHLRQGQAHPSFLPDISPPPRKTASVAPRKAHCKKQASPQILFRDEMGSPSASTITAPRLPRLSKDESQLLSIALNATSPTESTFEPP